MKGIFRTVILIVTVVSLSACASVLTSPTQIPVPTATSLPAFTSTPRPTITPAPLPTETPEPSATPTVRPTETSIPPSETSSEPVLPMPSGTPLASWNGIPIMPNAIAGDGDSAGYSFTILAEPDEVQDFYETGLAQLGWILFVTGQGSTDTVILMFTKGSDVLSMSIIPQPDGLIYVLLVK